MALLLRMASGMKRLELFPALLLLAACGGTEAPSSESALDQLETSYAGITTADEAPAFADDRVMSEDRADRDVPMRDRPDDVAGAHAAIVSIRYGHLVGDRAADSRWRFRVATDGAFARAQVFVEDDEAPQLERLEPGVVTWHSATPSGDHDGARFVVRFDAGDRGLAIETAGLQVGIPLEALADHESVHRTEAGQVYVRAHRLPADEQCRGGTIRARTTGLSGDGVGELFGVVRNREGDPIGHIRGRYGVRADGSHVLFAKMIGRGGEFLARVRGTFERIHRETIGVRARFQQVDGDASGFVHGRIVSEVDERGGALLARWSLDCDASIPRDRMPERSDDAERRR